MIDKGTATWDDIFGIAAPEVRSLAETLRAVILRRHPDVCETPYPGYRATVYGFAGRKMSEAYAYLMPHKAYVNLGFYAGIGLPDPAGLLEGTGKSLRHVKVRTQEQATSLAVAALVTAAQTECAKRLGMAL